MQGHQFVVSPGVIGRTPLHSRRLDSPTCMVNRERTRSGNREWGGELTECRSGYRTVLTGPGQSVICTIRAHPCDPWFFSFALLLRLGRPSRPFAVFCKNPIRHLKSFEF